MEVLQTIALVLIIYLSIILVISFISAVFAVRKGKNHARIVFKDVFWSFFIELLIPFNWF